MEQKISIITIKVVYGKQLVRLVPDYVRLKGYKEVVHAYTNKFSIAEHCALNHCSILNIKITHICMVCIKWFLFLNIISIEAKKIYIKKCLNIEKKINIKAHIISKQGI